MIIYRWENKINKKNYIGKWEGSIPDLINRYKTEIRKLSIKNRAIINGMRFYGLDNFELIIVHSDDNLSRKELEQLEIFYIKEFESLTTQNGYNCTRGGDGGDTFSYKTKEAKEESIKRMSGRTPWNKGTTGLMPTPWNKGKVGVYTEETRKNISKSLTGKKQSDETKRKHSESMKNKNLYNRIIFTDDELMFILENKQEGNKRLARLFNNKFGTKYSPAPFERIKQTMI